jgi:hypothetical protein
MPYHFQLSPQGRDDPAKGRELQIGPFLDTAQLRLGHPCGCGYLSLGLAQDLTHGPEVVLEHLSGDPAIELPSLRGGEPALFDLRPLVSLQGRHSSPICPQGHQGLFTQA